MSALSRIQTMLSFAGTANGLFPPTIFYNEGWLLRLVLDWFSTAPSGGYSLTFAPNARWFSEALLPSQFLARNRGDRLAEGWTHADGVIGHISIGSSALADTTLADGARQFIVAEAKLYSRLSPGVTNAAYFDQAARSAACIAEVLCRANRRPEQLSSLAFFLLAPSDQITAGVFKNEMSRDSIREKVSRRVAAYAEPTKDQWLDEWFLPTLERLHIACLNWDDVLRDIRLSDAAFGTDLRHFYERCLEFNRLQERDET